MNDRERMSGEEERLLRVLGAIRAEAEPALWTRARARIESRRRVPAPLAWAMRPAALAVSAVLLVLATGATWTLLSPGRDASTSSTASLVERLEAERGDSSAADDDLWQGTDSPVDSGAGS